MVPSITFINASMILTDIYNKKDEIINMIWVFVFESGVINPKEKVMIAKTNMMATRSEKADFKPYSAKKVASEETSMFTQMIV